MNKTIAALALIGAMTEPALACHRFHVWRYPWPQRCWVAPRAAILSHVAFVRRPSAPPHEPPSQPVLTAPSDDELRSFGIEELKRKLKEVDGAR